MCVSVDVEVEYGYEAEQPDELTIKVGDVIHNVITAEGGWWEGELNGKKGMFPDNFVKVTSCVNLNIFVKVKSCEFQTILSKLQAIFVSESNFVEQPINITFFVCRKLFCI